MYVLIRGKYLKFIEIEDIIMVEMMNIVRYEGGEIRIIGERKCRKVMKILKFKR